ncbi:MAG: hypothetical protein AB1779_12415, partial [Candidatus Thermoplasmatota archaeon]
MDYIFEFCGAICLITTILISTLIAFILYFKNLKNYNFISAEQAYMFYTSSIFKTYKKCLVAPWIILIFIATLILSLIISQLFYSPNLTLAVCSIGFCIGIVVMLILLLQSDKGIVDRLTANPPWAKALEKSCVNGGFQLQNKLFVFLQNLRLLVGWLSIFAVLLIFWGLIEIPFYLTSRYSFYYESSWFYLLVPLLKITVGALLLIGAYFLMVKPLKSHDFWYKMLGASKMIWRNKLIRSLFACLVILFGSLEGTEVMADKCMVVVNP